MSEERLSILFSRQQGRRWEEGPEFSLAWSFSSSPAAWEELPVLVLDSISAHLSLPDVGNMSAVCRKWREGLTKKCPVTRQAIEYARSDYEKRMRQRQLADAIERRRLRDERRIECWEQCMSDRMLFWWCFLFFIFPGFLQLAIGISGLVYFSSLPSLISVLPSCPQDVLIYTLIVVVGSFFVLNFVLFCLLSAFVSVGYQGGLRWEAIAFSICNTLGVCSNCVIVACAATNVSMSLQCAENPLLAYRAHAYCSVALAVGLLQLGLGIFFGVVFKHEYREFVYYAMHRFSSEPV